GVIRNSGGAQLTLAGNLTKNGRPLTLAGGVFRVTGRIAGASAADLLLTGATVTLANSTDNFNGPTFVTGDGILKNGAAEVLPNTTLLTLGEATNNTGGTYDLNGFDETIAGLASAGTGVKTVTNNGSGTKTLHVTGAGGAFDGQIVDGASGKVALTVSATGT